MLNLFSKKPELTNDPGPWGPFRLVELINTGGMANLWLATDSHGRTVAVRRLLPQLQNDGKAKKRFISGCEILAAVQEHDYVIGCFDHGKIQGVPYLAMEYIEGANLKEIIAEPTEELCCRIGNVLIDMGEALEHVHDCGYLHLDFKPENVLITANWNVRLIDFDLARPRQDRPFKLADNPGTPAYMSPEQLQRHPVDHRADIFAYGVCLYEILTGSKPFTGSSPIEILRNQIMPQKQIVPPRQLNPAIPAEVERTLLKSLEIDPAKRHGLMSVMLHDLRSTLYV